MHSGEINIDYITKIEGSAGLKVIIKDGQVEDLKFLIKDYRRFYTEAVKGKPYIAASAFLSRICGCSPLNCQQLCRGSVYSCSLFYSRLYYSSIVISSGQQMDSWIEHSMYSNNDLRIFRYIILGASGG